MANLESFPRLRGKVAAAGRGLAVESSISIYEAAHEA